MSNEWMKNGYLLITYYLLLITHYSFLRVRTQLLETLRERERQGRTRR
ncbi:MAG: hypothetical protein V7K77_02460 [Nostoc sp.]